MGLSDKIKNEFEKTGADYLEGYAYALYFESDSLLNFNKRGMRYVKPVSVIIENPEKYYVKGECRVFKKKKNGKAGTEIAFQKFSYFDASLKLFLTKEEAAKSFEKDLQKYKERVNEFKAQLNKKIEEFELDMHSITQLD